MKKQKEYSEMTAEEKVEFLEKQSADKDQILADQHAEIERLANRKLSKLETVEHKGKSYEVLIPSFILNQKHFTVDDLKKDASLIVTVLELDGQGILKLVE